MASFRFVHQYLYNQSPETHTFRLYGTPGYKVTNLSFGHSYGYPTEAALWEFKDWMTMIEKGTIYTLGDKVEITINWKDRLPYPKGLGIGASSSDLK